VVSNQLHTPVNLALKKSPRYLWNRIWVGPKAGLESVERRKKIPYPCQESNPGSIFRETRISVYNMKTICILV
jgi:hypothetical protein